MKHKALVVDDDPEIIDMVLDVLASIGHDHDAAGDQAEAHRFLAAGEYSYVLLDLEIPARGWRSRPRIQNSVNLLEQIRESVGMSDAPVIFMSDRVPKDSEVAVEMMRLATDLAGQKAVDYIHKPFPTDGRTLDRVIKKMLGLDGTPRRRRRRRSAKERKPRSVLSGKKDGSIDRAKAIDQKSDAPEARVIVPQQANAPENAPWDGIPNEPITLDQFMAKHCEKRSKEVRKYRRKALLAVARNSQRGKGSVTLPPPAVPHKNGRPKQYFTHDLLAAWRGFIEEGVDLPPLLARHCPAAAD